MKKEKGSWKEIKKAGIVECGTSLAIKTGKWKAMFPVVDQDKCIRCQQCVVYCPDLCIEEIKGKIIPDLDYCKGCGLCAKMCPVNAITMEKVKNE